MHITLIHNPKAGEEGTAKEDLLEHFERAGHEVDYYSTKKKDFPRGLDNPGDIVVIAGGDGTVRKVCRRLIGRNVPVAIMPLGTANNIAKALDAESDPRKMVRALARSRPIKFDVGVVRGPWGDVPFFEAAGAGLFPLMMSTRHSNQQEGVPDVIDGHGGMRGGALLLQQVLHGFSGHECQVKLDGIERTGKFLLIEAMNIRSIGPAIELAPHANPGDGFLDVVLIREDQRDELHRHVSPQATKKKPATFALHRVRDLELSCAAAEFHFDDECWPDHLDKESRRRKPSTREIHVEATLFPGALRVMIPQ